MRYDVTSPVKGYNGVVGGVTFYRGRAHVDDATHFAAVEYMRRRGYKLTEVREEQAEGEPDADGLKFPHPGHVASGPVKPKAADNKEAWVAYVVATTDLTEAEAADLTKVELQELTEEKKEQS